MIQWHAIANGDWLTASCCMNADLILGCKPFGSSLQKEACGKLSWKKPWTMSTHSKTETLGRRSCCFLRSNWNKLSLSVCLATLGNIQGFVSIEDFFQKWFESLVCSAAGRSRKRLRRLLLKEGLQSKTATSARTGRCKGRTFPEALATGFNKI